MKKKRDQNDVIQSLFNKSKEGSQQEARIQSLISALRTIRCAIELSDHWKPSMTQRLIEIATNAIDEEEEFKSRSDEE